MQATIVYSADQKVPIITVDKEAFLAEVKKYFDISPVTKEWQDVKKLSWPNALVPPQLWDTIKEITDLVKVTCAAVEIAKQKVIKEHDPDGSKGAKFDREVALGAAVSIVASLIKFNGIVGSVMNKLWLPLINIMISMYVNGQGASWATVAFQILQIAL